jgi:hypothetical protein
MGLEIVCVERKGKKAGHRHVTVIGVDTTKVVIRFSVKTVRRIIKEGTVDFFYTGPDGLPVAVRRYKCRCGAKTIRAVRGPEIDGELSQLASCSSWLPGSGS